MFNERRMTFYVNTQFNYRIYHMKSIFVRILSDLLIKIRNISLTKHKGINLDWSIIINSSYMLQSNRDNRVRTKQEDDGALHWIR
jgi:hypothetical protein